MGSAKKIVVRPIGATEAVKLVQRVHYSGTVTQNSQLHLGVYFAGKLEGVMQFGPPLARRLVLPLVRGTLWNQMLELNRMAFTDALPRNSESRALSIAFRMLRKHRPDIKWILSYSDATQCGDGAIYRASGFKLTDIKINQNLFILPDGRVIQSMTLSSARPTPIQMRLREKFKMPTASPSALIKAAGGKRIPGYQFRYIRFLDPSWEERLTVPVIPFADIPAEARMYRGEKKRQPVEGGCTPAVERRGRSDPGATTK